jgi:hypothetical protein
MSRREAQIVVLIKLVVAVVGATIWGMRAFSKPIGIIVSPQADIFWGWFGKVFFFVWCMLAIWSIVSSIVDVKNSK